VNFKSFEFSKGIENLKYRRKIPNSVGVHVRVQPDRCLHNRGETRVVS
jgi:hypothetical protein